MDELITLLADLVIKASNHADDYDNAQHLVDVGSIYRFIHKYLLSL
ncbi:hypothetical protein [Staphylococcus cohnii]